MGFKSKILTLLVALTVIIVLQMLVSYRMTGSMGNKIRENSMQTMDDLSRLVGRQKLEWSKDELRVNLSELDELLDLASERVFVLTNYFINQSRLARNSSPLSEISRKQVEEFSRKILARDPEAVNGFGVTFETGAYSSYTPYFNPYVYRDENGIAYSDDEVGELPADDPSRSKAQVREEYELELSDSWYATVLPVGSDRDSPPEEKVYWVKPYIDTTTSVPIISASYPVVDDGRALGVAFVDLSLAGLDELTKRAAGSLPGSMAVTFEFESGGVFADFGLPELAPTAAAGRKAAPADAAAVAAGQPDGAETDGPGERGLVMHTLSEVMPAETAGSLVRDLEAGDVRSVDIKFRGADYVVLVANLQGLFGIAVLIPESELFAAVAQVRSSGEALVESQRADLNGLKAATGASLFLLLLVMAVISAFISRTVSKIINIAKTLYMDAETIFSTSSNVSDDAMRLDEHGRGQMTALGDTSTAITEISGQLHETAVMASDCTKAMEESKRQVETGARTVEAMQSAMDSIDKATGEVNKILQSIESIAFQTNLLALNASVEASRAGEAGHGFAVVANEVRNLSVATSESAKRTGALLEAVMRRVKEGQNAATNLASSFKGIEEVVVQADHYADGIRTSTKEEVANVDAIASSLASLSSLVADNNEVANDSKQSSEALSTQAETLNGTSIKLLGILMGEHAEVEFSLDMRNNYVRPRETQMPKEHMARPQAITHAPQEARGRH
ncbi:MAG: methyl-accepting chemotaxis protein [Deltaproteobacteria bacterium]|jgi:methyl-accepting chemotaxis protein|nr:methyl-accepting chemotaxis protein [Deltaproteobacteria bacterium]